MTNKKQIKQECPHNNGWISIDNFCVGIDTSIDETYDYQLVGKFRCNNLDCREIKTFRFAIENFQEIK